MKNVWKWDTPKWGNVFTAASHVNLRVIELNSHYLTLIAFKIFVQSWPAPRERLRDASFVYPGVESTYQSCARIRLIFLFCIWDNPTWNQISYILDSHLKGQLSNFLCLPPLTRIPTLSWVVFLASFDISISQQEIFHHSESTQFNQFDP